MNELKPCPFCGGEASIMVIEPHKHFLVNLPDYEGGAYIECNKCSCAMSGKTEEDVVESWNRRAEIKQNHSVCDGCIHESSTYCEECGRDSHQAARGG